MPIIYLGSPYTDPSPEIRAARAEMASRAAAYLMQQGFAVFSPITHGHAIAEHLPSELLHSHEFWMAQCLPFLDRSHALVILPFPGWGRSRGLAFERRRAEDLNIPELFMPLNFPESFLEQLKSI